ncbi:MAG: sulfatase [Verrucomicrobia bacterium]|nr:sulfatase [Verrucomicrobiota bacterium]
MKKASSFSYCAALAVASFGVVSVAQAEPQKTKKPLNVIYIMSDDHAVQAISAYGHPVGKLAPTPNIDRIANNGALFMRNYCANSISGPSRACVLTGKHSHANGYMSNEWGTFDNRQNNVAKVFHANGYQTGIIGKIHLPSDPTGFDWWQVFIGQGHYINPDLICGDINGRFKGPKGHIIAKGYSTDIVTHGAINWLENTRDKSKPFFFMVHYKAPHRNWIPKEKYYNLYDNVTFPEPENFFDNYEGRFAAKEQDMSLLWTMRWAADLKLFPSKDQRSLPRWMFPPRMSDKQYQAYIKAYTAKNDAFFDAKICSEAEWNEWRKHRRDEAWLAANKDKLQKFQSWAYQRYMQDYLATIRGVDDGVGELLDYLKKSGLDENTVVCYTSDQGFYLGEHGWFDKRFMYEESFRMPMMMSGPGIVKGNKINQLTQNIDFAPTFLDMCGIAVPEEMQGESFKKLLESDKPVKEWRDSLYYCYYEYPAEHSVRRHCGVSYRSPDGSQDWKLIHFYKEDKWELFNLNADPSEMNNIYGQPGTEEITAMLKKKLKELQKKYNVPEEYMTPGTPRRNDDKVQLQPPLKQPAVSK